MVPQLDCAWIAHIPCGSELAVTATQVPAFPAMLQAWQAVLQALLQQTPCTHWPLKHWPAFAQGCPSAFFPHELATPAMPQVFGATHCVSLVHAVKQESLLHWKGLQLVAPGRTQLPSALQVDGWV